MLEKYGYNTFKCTYTPEDTSNYNVITGLEVTIKVTDKLVVNVENYVTKLVENEDKEEIIYITGIMADEGIDQIKNSMETNGEIKFYEEKGAEIANDKAKAKTGMRAKIKTEAETVEYVLIVSGDNNGDGKFNAIDLLKLARYLADIDKDLKGEFLYACDVHKDEEINQSDLLKMARVLSGLDKF